MIKNRLKVLLAEREMTLAELARTTGGYYTTIYRFAQNDREFLNVPTLDAVCEALGVQPGDIFVHVPNERTGEATEEKALAG